METLNTLQKFIVAWMDKAWWSMRDRVGALSMIEILTESWQAGGQEVGGIAKREGMNLSAAVETAHFILGRTVQVKKDSIEVLQCPIWDRMLAGGLEYALRCEEFICAPYLTGIKEAVGGKEAFVETNLRLAHVNRTKLEYKISQIEGPAASDSNAKAQLKELRRQLQELPKQPACIFRVK